MKQDLKIETEITNSLVIIDQSMHHQAVQLVSFLSSTLVLILNMQLYVSSYSFFLSSGGSARGSALAESSGEWRGHGEH
jgi:hypothetical protein